MPRHYDTIREHILFLMFSMASEHRPWSHHTVAIIYTVPRASLRRENNRSYRSLSEDRSASGRITWGVAETLQRAPQLRPSVADGVRGRRGVNHPLLLEINPRNNIGFNSSLIQPWNGMEIKMYFVKE